MSDSPAMHREAFNMLCADRLGFGMSRVTWSSNVLPDCVIKVEENSHQFQNIMEWEIWQRVIGTPFEKWFAPCKWISPNGSVLIMARTTPPAEYPEEMPYFLSDFKRENYGMYQGRLVCHDYGTTLMLEYGMTKRMRKIKWS